MDAVYFYKHSPHGGEEIRYSLRSLEKHAPYIRKVWIFGDRPNFLSRNKKLIEHVSHEDVNIIGAKIPVTNFFLLHFLSSLIPDLSHDYLRLSDDFVLLDRLSEEDARKDRYAEDLTNIPLDAWKLNLSTEWQDCLRMTHHYFKRLHYKNIYSFETHAPAFMTKTRCMKAYLAMQGSVTEHRFTGLMGATAILNYADDLNLEKVKLLGVYVSDPGLQWLEKNQRPFLNFDDAAFGRGMKAFLRKKFPNPSKYERK